MPNPADLAGYCHTHAPLLPAALVLGEVVINVPVFHFLALILDGDCRCGSTYKMAQNFAICTQRLSRGTRLMAGEVVINGHSSFATTRAAYEVLSRWL